MDQINKMLDRPKQYYNIDGVGELGIGFMLLVFGLLLSMQLNAPKGSLWHSMYTFNICVGLMCLIIHFGSKAIKKHITYPRTGFVQYRKRGKVWGMLSAMVISALTVGLIFALRERLDTTTPVLLLGLLFAASYAYGIARAVRWKWAVSWMMLLGSLTIAILPPDLLEALHNSELPPVLPLKLVVAIMLVFILCGVLSTISGGISFWFYLRHTQAPAQDNQ
jgi:hypothetical protein